MKNATPAQMRTGLRIHAIAFMLSMLLMLVINLLTGSPYWAAWVLLGWGVGLLSHWLGVRRHLTQNVPA
jgi:uncharacterized membrane protein